MITKQEALDKFHKRELSWSSISSFEWNKEEWFEKYILDIKPETSPEMEFGKKIGKLLELNPSYLPEVPRYGMDEYKFKVIFNKIPLIGFADSFNHITWNQLGERKTGVKEWDQKRVNQHGQLTLYCLQNYIQNRVNPKDVEITLTWIPTKKVRKGHFGINIDFDPKKPIKTFKTKRSMTDIIKFGQKINKIYKEMEEFIEQKLSTSDSLQ